MENKDLKPENAFGIMPEQDAEKLIAACYVMDPLRSREDVESLAKRALKARVDASLFQAMIDGDIVPLEINDGNFTFTKTDQGEKDLPTKNPGLAMAMDSFEQHERSKN